ncbi:MAG: cyclase family protein, partial [Erysipelotrichaceae bacterium]|nr:cyclase family protein [Erysipelotrichaceae bacterium]
MKIYDISQEVFNCNVYPGDPKAKVIALNRMSEGDVYNLSAFSMCAHNGTHVDAPFHFIQEGKTVDQLCLEALVGWACVIEHEGVVSASDAAKMIEKAKALGEEGWHRMLIKGKAEVGEEAAKAFVDAGI